MKILREFKMILISEEKLDKLREMNLSQKLKPKKKNMFKGSKLYLMRNRLCMKLMIKNGTNIGRNKC
jgi:hypothetical protein